MSGNENIGQAEKISRENKKVENFTVLMSVYFKEKSEYLKDSLISVMNNTVIPNEIIIVEDGPLTTELYRCLDEMQDIYPCIKRVKLPRNEGLGKALNIGISACTNNLVARMDTDDICVPDRFQRQLDFFRENDVDVLGGQIIEFDEPMKTAIAYRYVPTTDEQIKSFAKTRNPMNHMTVMYKKSVIESVGGYRNILYFEDYDLWVRLILNGAIFANLSEVLVHVRAGNSMLSRRGGIKYAKLELNFLRELHDIGFLSTREFLRAAFVRTPVRLMPKNLRKMIYTVFLHKRRKIRE